MKPCVLNTNTVEPPLIVLTSLKDEFQKLTISVLGFLNLVLRSIGDFKWGFHCNGVGRETIILPDVLYGRETWCLTLREEQRQRVFENRVLRIFGPKRMEVTGGWRKLHNEELHNLYSLPHIIRIIT
jgi:hypothetical protein